MSDIQPSVPRAGICGRCLDYHPTETMAGVGHCMNVFRVDWKMLVTSTEVYDCWRPKDWSATLDYMIGEATEREISELGEALAEQASVATSLLEFLVQEGSPQQRAWFENWERK